MYQDDDISVSEDPDSSEEEQELEKPGESQLEKEFPPLKSSNGVNVEIDKSPLLSPGLPDYEDLVASLGTCFEADLFDPRFTSQNGARREDEDGIEQRSFGGDAGEPGGGHSSGVLPTASRTPASLSEMPSQYNIRLEDSTTYPTTKKKTIRSIADLYDPEPIVMNQTNRKPMDSISTRVLTDPREPNKGFQPTWTSMDNFRPTDHWQQSRMEIYKKLGIQLISPGSDVTSLTQASLRYPTERDTLAEATECGTHKDHQRKPQEDWHCNSADGSQDDVGNTNGLLGQGKGTGYLPLLQEEFEYEQPKEKVIHELISTDQVGDRRGGIEPLHSSQDKRPEGQQPTTSYDHAEPGWNRSGKDHEERQDLQSESERARAQIKNVLKLANRRDQIPARPGWLYNSPCRFVPNCNQSENCPFKHPTDLGKVSQRKDVLCRDSAGCHRSFCWFQHPGDTPTFVTRLSVLKEKPIGQSDRQKKGREEQIIESNRTSIAPEKPPGWVKREKLEPDPTYVLLPGSEKNKNPRKGKGKNRKRSTKKKNTGEAGGEENQGSPAGEKHNRAKKRGRRGGKKKRASQKEAQCTVKATPPPEEDKEPPSANPAEQPAPPLTATSTTG